MKRRKLFTKPVHFIIGAFFLTFLFMLTFCERVEARDWAVEVQHDSNGGTTDYNAGLDKLCVRYKWDSNTTFTGCPVLGTSATREPGAFALGVGQVFGTTGVAAKWEGEIHYSRWRGRSNGGLTIRRMVGDGPFQLGFGLTQWIEDSFGSGSDQTFNLVLRYNF